MPFKQLITSGDLLRRNENIFRPLVNAEKTMKISRFLPVVNVKPKSAPRVMGIQIRPGKWELTFIDGARDVIQSAHDYQIKNHNEYCT